MDAWEAERREHGRLAQKEAVNQAAELVPARLMGHLFFETVYRPHPGNLGSVLCAIRITYSGSKWDASLCVAATWEDALDKLKCAVEDGKIDQLLAMSKAVDEGVERMLGPDKKDQAFPDGI